MLIDRLKSKFLSAGIIILIALVVAGVIAGLLYILYPYLPADIRQLITLLRANDWDANREILKTFFDSYGTYSPWLFFLLQLLQTLLAPIPGQFTGLLGGFLFGFWPGVALSMLAILLGSLIVMLAGRIFGQQILRRFIPDAILYRFDVATLEQGGVLNFFMIFLLPAFPDDALCFVAGLTRLSIPKLMLASFLGRLPGVAVLTFTGASLNANIVLGRIIFGLGVFMALLIWLFDEELIVWGTFISEKLRTK